MVDSIYSSNSSHSESFTYDDNYGRLISASRRMPDKTFINSYTYDWFGRPWTRTYPSGYEIEYTYNDGGHLGKITGDGTTIWSCGEVNELGQITSYSQGDYTTTVDYDPFGMLEEITTGSVFNMTFDFDDLGNLTSREDVLTSQKELFEYDDLSRLTGIDYYLNNAHITSEDLNLSYGDDGNISSKTDVGSTINYGEGTAGPHALTSIETPAASYTAPPQIITYNNFNKVNTIQDTIGQDTTLTLAFTYGLNNQRVKTVLSKNSTVEQIKYFNGDYEEDSTATGIKKYHYINAPSGLVGIFVQEGSADTLFHVIKDHLGSVSAVINAETDSITYFSYNAWGIPRNPEDWPGAFEGELFAGRGYTGHEHLSEFNLINMNGRVYDPVLGRFLSPDPFIQFPGVADGHNRYAYVMNNPLLYTDPSGYNAQLYVDAIVNYLRKRGLDSWSTSDGFHNAIDLPHMQMERGSGGAGVSMGGYGYSSYRGAWSWVIGVTKGKEKKFWGYDKSRRRETKEWVSNWTIPNFDRSGLWENSNSFAGFGGPRNSSPGGASNRGGKPGESPVNMHTTNDPIGDILRRVAFLEQNGGLPQNTLDNIIIQNGYSTSTYSMYHKPITRDRRTFDLMIIAPPDLEKNISRYTVFRGGFGNIDQWYDRPFNPNYNSGFPIGFFIHGYQSNDLIRIGASSNSDYLYLLNFYKSLK